MAEEIVASPTVLVNGENEANNKEFADAVAVEEEKTSDKDAAAASGDRDAAVELLIEEIRDLKKARLDFQRERSGLLFELSDGRAKLTSTESELKAVAAQASRLEGQLRIVQDDLSTANMSASEHEEEIRRLQAVIKDLEGQLRIVQDDLSTSASEHEEEIRRLQDVIKDLEANFKIKVRDLNEELRVSAQDKDDALRAKELELEELRSQIVDEKEKNLQNRDMQGGVNASLTQSRALGTASAVGVAAVALGTLVCFYLAKRK